ncbi:Astacin-like metalloendopeptidase [Leptotrombidium deliense]|uniref:Astacin-like metalloendopeptidase n=1 Tax=Leptotrombidium deliense TaxID=299467 RepID=A0A443S6W6_9ACAR|nr:Astacin-like metalloendopeptidase [Leptotrombidium deliense]
MKDNRSCLKVCGGEIKNMSGIITSPNFPNNYPPNVNCEWIIENDDNDFVFKCDSFSLEGKGNVNVYEFNYGFYW